MALGQAKFFSTWDLPIGDQDRQKTILITTLALFEFNHMPLVMPPEPSSAIFSKTFEEHLKHLDQVFSCLAQYRLKLKPSKCYLVR